MTQHATVPLFCSQFVFLIMMLWPGELSGPKKEGTTKAGSRRLVQTWRKQEMKAVRLWENCRKTPAEKQQKGLQETTLINSRTGSTEQDGIIQPELVYKEKVTSRLQPGEPHWPSQTVGPPHSSTAGRQRETTKTTRIRTTKIQTLTHEMQHRHISVASKPEPVFLVPKLLLCIWDGKKRTIFKYVCMLSSYTLLLHCWWHTVCPWGLCNFLYCHIK